MLWNIKLKLFISELFSDFFKICEILSKIGISGLILSECLTFINLSNSRAREVIIFGWGPLLYQLYFHKELLGSFWWNFNFIKTWLGTLYLQEDLTFIKNFLRELIVIFNFTKNWLGTLYLQEDLTFIKNFLGSLLLSLMS